MRISTTIALAVVSVLLAVTTAVVEHAPTRDEALAANVLVRFDQDAVDRLSIGMGENTTVIEKRGGNWFFTAPEQDRVDTRSIGKLLDELNHLSIVDTVGGSGETLSAEQTGLSGEGRIEITVSGKPEKGKSFEESFVLGSPAPRENSLYAEQGGDQFVVEGNIRPALEQPLSVFRDLRLLSAPPEAIVQLGITRPTGKLAVQRKLTPPQQNWALSEPIQVWASPEKLDELLADLANLRLNEIVGDASGTEDIPNPLPEGEAVIQVRVLGIEKPLTLYLKQVEAPAIEGAPATLEARVSDRPKVYRLQSTILEKLPKDADDLRDRTLARIPEQFLEAIYIQSRIDPDVRLLSRPTNEGLRWEVDINDKLFPANSSEVSRLVSGVNSAAILDFASDTGEDLASYGLMPPARRITFSMSIPGVPAEDGTPGPPRALERSLNLGWREGDQQRLFANFEGEPYVYELDPSFANLVATHPIKWRSLNVLTFHKLHLQSITREIPGRGEKLKLDYDYKIDRWTAMRNGVEVPTLDQMAARRLQERLGGLTAQGWYLSLANAYSALQEPSAIFEIVTKELDAAVGEARPKTYRLIFAQSNIVIPPSNEPLYFGRLEGANDVFFLDNETYRNLVRPVTTAREAR